MLINNKIAIRERNLLEVLARRNSGKQMVLCRSLAVSGALGTSELHGVGPVVLGERETSTQVLSHGGLLSLEGSHELVVNLLLSGRALW